MRKTFSLVAALAILAFALSAKAAIFLNIEGFKGEASAKGHPGVISALRFDLVLTGPRESATGGAGAGKITHSPLVVTKDIDAASPQLYQALVTNERFPTVTLELARPEAGGKEAVYYTVKLTNAVISLIRQHTDEMLKTNVEDLTFTYEKIEFENGAGAKSSEAPATHVPNLRMPGK